MQHQHINTSFIRQFRHANAAYHGIDESRVGNFWFKRFAGKEKELQVVEQWLESEVSFDLVVDEIVAYLYGEDIPLSRNVCAAAQKLQKMVAPEARKEQHVMGYYSRLSEVVSQLPEIVESFRTNVQEHLLDSLTDFLSEKINGDEERFVYSDEIEAAQGLFGQYADEMREHYDELCLLLQEEAGQNDDPRVTTPIEELLLNLVMYIGKSIFRAEATNAHLEEWKLQLAGVEYQEVYN